MESLLAYSSAILPIYRTGDRILVDLKYYQHLVRCWSILSRSMSILQFVASKGKDLPSGKNFADYINEKGQMQLLKFFADHQKSFPTLWILVQKEASRRVVEVGCERFFELSGYVSLPRCTRHGVHNYE
jgi:hypothetical protein